MIAEHLNPGQQRDGRFVRFEYDANNRVIRKTDPPGAIGDDRRVDAEHGKPIELPRR